MGLNPVPARTVASVALTGALLTAGTVTADAVTARNPTDSPTATKPGTCQVTRTMQGRLVAHFGGGNPTSTTYLIRELRKAGFTWEEVPAALTIARGESQLCKHARHYNRATNGFIKSTDYGMFQINTYWHPWAKRLDLDTVSGNAQAARRIYLDAGRSWKPWHASKYAGQWLPWAQQQVQIARKAGVK